MTHAARAVFVAFLDAVLPLVRARFAAASGPVRLLTEYRDAFARGEVASRHFAAVLYNGRLAGHISDAEISIFEKEICGPAQRLWPPPGVDLELAILDAWLEALGGRLGPASQAYQRVERYRTAHVVNGERDGRYDALHGPTPLPPDELAFVESDAFRKVTGDVEERPPVPKRNRPLP